MLAHRRIFIGLIFSLFVTFAGISSEPYMLDSAEPESVIYDTVIVYDTIWEYETVYDTIWIFDTVFVPPPQPSINWLYPIKAYHVYPTLNSYHHKRVENALLKKMYSYEERKQVLTENTPTRKYPKYRKPRKTFTPKYGVKLTLNPQNGVFNPRLFRQGIYSLEPYFGLSKQQTQYSPRQGNLFAENITAATKPLTGYEYGLKIDYRLFQYGAQSGMGISQLRDQFNYEQVEVFVDSLFNPYEYSVLENRVDTINYLDVDALIHGDTVWNTYYFPYDTLVYYDSSYFTYDTTRNTIYQQSANRIFLFELPLVFTYNLGINNAIFQLKLGGINQLYLISQGKTFLAEDRVEDINTATLFTKYNIALYGGIGVKYYITNYISVFFDAYYKYPLRKFSKVSTLTFRKQSYGLHFGIGYRLN